jgi:hypothetical protein
MLLRCVFDSVEFHEVKTRRTRRLIKAKSTDAVIKLTLNSLSLDYSCIIWLHLQYVPERFVVIRLCSCVVFFVLLRHVPLESSCILPATYTKNN